MAPAHMAPWARLLWQRVCGQRQPPLRGCVFQPRGRVVLVKSLHLSEALTLSQDGEVVAHVRRGAVTGLSGVAEAKQQT